MNSTQQPHETSKSALTPPSAGNGENYKDKPPVGENPPSGGMLPVKEGAVLPAAPSAATGAATTAPPASGTGAAAGTGSSGAAAAGADRKPEADEHVARARRQSEGAPAPVIPDFCNLGIANRALGILHLGLLAMVLMQSHLWFGVHHFQHLLLLLLTFEVPVLISMFVLCRVRKVVNGLTQRQQWLAGLGIPVMVTMVVTALFQFVWDGYAVYPGMNPAYAGSVVVANGLAALLIALALYKYFRLRARAMAPSFSEARLQALQARIRPHFLFNSLNTVLGLIRSDPKKAESTLLNLADLFRVFMRDARELVPLDDEVVTCKEYLAIEKLRLEPRLEVVWNIDGMPGDALLPSLLLQPLLENAVHHGIEPRTDTGVLNISIMLVGERVRVEVDNPISATVASRPGNQMALSNVRERLMLLYDTEAELRTGPQGDRYHVLLEFPYRKERRRRDVRRHFNPDR